MGNELLQGHPRFYQLCREIAELHSRKNSDYAQDDDPLSNLRRCERISIPAWKGVLVRLEDKWDRTEKVANKGDAAVKDESLIDTLKDTAVYSLLCIILLEEQEKQK